MTMHRSYNSRVRDEREMCPSGITSSITAANPDFRSAFEVIEADHDGKISSDDLWTFYAGIPRSSSSHSGGDRDEEIMIGTMISVADANKEGFVEYDEFEKVLETAPSCRSGNGLMKDVFKVMDKDRDGRLSYGDLKSYMESAGLDANDDEIKESIRLGDFKSSIKLKQNFLGEQIHMWIISSPWDFSPSIRNTTQKFLVHDSEQSSMYVRK